MKDLRVYAHHGVFSEERKLGQFFSIDLVIYTDFKTAIETDCIKNTLNYVEIINFIELKFKEKSFCLIESAANFLCDSILENFVVVTSINIVLKKLNPPINSDLKYVAVEVSKSRHN